jgi:hypothetical protein
MRDDELIFFESFLFALIIPLSPTQTYISPKREMLVLNGSLNSCFAGGRDSTATDSEQQVLDFLPATSSSFTKKLPNFSFGRKLVKTNFNLMVCALGRGELVSLCV